MARQARTSVKRKGNQDIIMGGGIGPEERERMIREAAYYRFAERGFVAGHELEDWLAAESEIDRAGGTPQPSEAAATPEFEVQQSATHGPREDEALKRTVRRHPRRDIPRIESVEPQEAPMKE